MIKEWLRPLNSVIDAMMNQIPEDYVDAQDLLQDFSRIKRSYRYAPPELHSFWWSQLADSLNYYIQIPQSDWQIKLRDIFNAEDDYQKYLKSN